MDQITGSSATEMSEVSIVAESEPAAESEPVEGSVTLADIYASVDVDTDPTGDFAAGRTRFHESTEAFLTDLTERDRDLLVCSTTT